MIFLYPSQDNSVGHKSMPLSLPPHRSDRWLRLLQPGPPALSLLLVPWGPWDLWLLFLSLRSGRWGPLLPWGPSDLSVLWPLFPSLPSDRWARHSRKACWAGGAGRTCRSRSSRARRACWPRHSCQASGTCRTGCGNDIRATNQHLKCGYLKPRPSDCCSLQSQSLFSTHL